MNLTQSRLCLGGCALALAATVLVGVEGQEDPLRGGVRRLMQGDAALPAIDRGLRAQDVPGDPAVRLGAPQTVDRTAAMTSEVYLPDSVIVKFKGGTDRTAAVNSTMSQVSGSSADRPSWADFDVVTIGPGVDPEVAAAELAARGDVEYAQPRYLNHAMSKPNDPLYVEPVELPRHRHGARVGHPAGRRAVIIVAVLDSGVAFKSATFRYNSRFPFRLTPSGPVYPALGMVDVPFAAAPELGDSSRVRRAARLHLGRQRPGRPRRPRHARLGHDRPAHQQQRRRAPAWPTTSASCR